MSFQSFYTRRISKTLGTPTVTVAADLAAIVGGEGDTLASLSGQIDGLTVGSSSVPTADATDNDVTADVVGNKEDALVSAVGTTKSLVGYIKGLIQELAQRSVPKMAMHYTDSTSYVDVVNITDKGVLTGINQVVTNLDVTGDFTSLKVIIDGTTVYDGLSGYAPNAIGIYQGIALSFNHRFNTSLQIQHKVSSVVDVRPRTFVSYTID